MLQGISDNLEKYMDVLSARQKLVASNIANVDTPGYRTKDLSFEAEFANQLNHAGPPAGQEISGLRTKNDGNNVSLDRETRLLAENSIRFSAASNLLKGQFRVLKTAIHEGQA